MIYRVYCIRQPFCSSPNDDIWICGFAQSRIEYRCLLNDDTPYIFYRVDWKGDTSHYFEGIRKVFQNTSIALQWKGSGNPKAITAKILINGLLNFVLTRTLLDPFLFNPFHTPALYYINILPVLINVRLCTGTLFSFLLTRIIHAFLTHFLLVAHPVHLIPLYFITLITDIFGARCGVMVKALRHKPAGRGFDSRWCHWNFSVT
jgi:hypothetical protein